jgi:hypothetical protein
MVTYAYFSIHSIEIVSISHIVCYSDEKWSLTDLAIDARSSAVT